MSSSPTVFRPPIAALPSPVRETWRTGGWLRLSWPLAIGLLCALLVCLLPGTLGHTPWKQDEAYSFGIIQHMVESGQLLVPTNAGQPFLEKPPLYYWTATLFAHWLRPVLPLHDAARLASAFYTGLAAVFVSLFARASFAAARLTDRRVLMTLALYLGSVGMIKHVHDLFTDVALCAGVAIGLYGLQCLAASAAARWRDAVWLGLGVGMAAMSKGLFIPAIFALSSVLLPVLLPACRTRCYLNRLLLAGLVALPLAATWPVLLAWQAPDLFDVWFWQNNVGRFVGYSVPALGAGATPTRVVEAFLTVVFPGSLLAVFYLLCGGWRKCRRPGVAVPLLFSALGLAVLQASATSRYLYLLPFTAPLAVLGVRGLLLLPPRGLDGIQWGLRGLFSALLILVWGIYLLSLPAATRSWLTPLGTWLPMDFVMPVQPLALVFAVALTVLWLRRRCGYPSHRPLAVALEWLSGMVLVWSLAFTLLLPWMEAAKGYQGVYRRMSASLAGKWQPGDCMASYELGESEAPMLYYFTGILHQPVTALPQAERCRWLLAETRGAPMPPPSGWVLFWRGSREGDMSEHLTLFERAAH